MPIARSLARPLVLAATLLLVASCGAKETAMTEPTPSGTAGAPPTTPAPAPVVLASAIPVAHTPAGGYGATMPAPVLAGCTEPLPAGVPDLRGLWKAVSVTVGGRPAPDHKAMGHIERIEQCGTRVVITAGGVVHDMVCDGTEANGVHDVAEMDFTTPITVVATFEHGVHTLRPVGIPGVEVTRRLDGEQLVWDYLGFTARLERLGPPDLTPPA